MKAVGIVRRLDDLGRITVPAELRDTFELEKATPMEIFAEDNGIYIKKYEPCCTFCKSEENIHSYLNKFVCDKCIENLNTKM